jgi:twitching motility two-component system response regulator PilG
MVEPIPASKSETHKSVPVIRVLVVDDSLAVRQYMKTKLASLSSDFDLDVDLADSGEDALQKVAVTAYDLVFLDVVMPGMSGHDVCRRIKQIRKTRVAMLSSLKSQQDHESGHIAGCDNYLTKPPEDADLQAVLRIVSLRKTIGLG